MANALFDPGREGILDETIGMSSGDIRCMLVKSTYTFSAAHKFITDLGSVDNGRSAALASKTFTSGVFDAATGRLVERLQSDGSGNFVTSPVGLGRSYQIDGYKSGAPDLAGTTLNTLQGS